MQRLHRIFANGNRAFKSFLDQAHIAHEYEESIVGKTVFLLISESDENWPILAANLKEFDVSHTVELQFTKRDIRSASWCELGVTSHFGYPQPEDDFGYRGITYAPDVGCCECGIGLIQVAPFRLSEAPSVKKSPLLQLNWVFGEFFVSAEARAQIKDAKIIGIKFEPPVIHRSGKRIPGWHQMQVIETAEAEVDTSRFTVETCTKCSRTKLNYPEGELLRFQSHIGNSGSDAYRTMEWFGSGASAHRGVLVSQRFVKLMLDMKWRGVRLTPVEP